MTFRFDRRVVYGVYDESGVYLGDVEKCKDQRWEATRRNHVESRFIRYPFRADAAEALAKNPR